MDAAAAKPKLAFSGYPHLKGYRSALVKDMSSKWMEEMATSQELWVVALTHGDVTRFAKFSSH